MEYAWLPNAMGCSFRSDFTGLSGRFEAEESPGDSKKRLLDTLMNGDPDQIGDEGMKLHGWTAI